MLASLFLLWCLFDSSCMHLSALNEWIVLYKPECTYLYYTNRLLNDQVRVYVSATECVHMREGGQETLVKMKIIFNHYYFRLKMRE